MAHRPFEDRFGSGGWKLWLGLVVLLFAVLIPLRLLGLLPSPAPDPDEVLEALEVPEPPSVSVPVLLEVAPGTELDSMCVTFRLRGRGRAEMEREFLAGMGRERQSIEDRTAEMLRMAGVDLVDTGCTASLVVEVDAGWSIASYETLGACATGYDLEGEATFRVGDVGDTWTTEHTAGPPPMALSGPGCRRSDAEIRAKWWYGDLVAAPFAELIGAPGEAAAWMTDTFQAGELHPPDDTAIAIAVEGLRGDFYDDAVGLIVAWAEQHPGDEHLDALVPFLIEGFASHPGPGGFHTALSYITGEQLEDGRPTYDWEPGDWYEWWTEE